MNYKNILLSILLLPATIMSYGKSVVIQIKELEEAKFKKELEVSETSALIRNKHTLLDQHKCNAMYYWISEHKNESEEAIEASYNQCIETLKSIFDAKKNINQIIETELFYHNSSEALRFALLRVVAEKCLINSLIIRYLEKLQELIAINQKIYQLSK